MDRALRDAKSLAKRRYSAFQPGVKLSTAEMKEERAKLIAWLDSDQFELFVRFLGRSADDKRNEIRKILGLKARCDDA